MTEKYEKAEKTEKVIHNQDIFENLDLKNEKIENLTEN